MEKRCKFQGCDKSSYWKNEGKRGWCSIHYRRWQRHGNPSICKYAPDGSGCVFRGYKIFTINGKQILEHRYIMEQYLGRKLKLKEIIHHINENTLDNRIENLEIMTQNKHASMHGKKRFNHLDIPCENCKKIFRCGSYRQQINKHNFCSRVCASIARRIGGISHVKYYFKQNL